jgi:hypothetical protein
VVVDANVRHGTEAIAVAVQPAPLVTVHEKKLVSPLAGTDTLFVFVVPPPVHEYEQLLQFAGVAVNVTLLPGVVLVLDGFILTDGITFTVPVTANRVADTQLVEVFCACA